EEVRRWRVPLVKRYGLPLEPIELDTPDPVEAPVFRDALLHRSIWLRGIAAEQIAGAGVTEPVAAAAEPAGGAPVFLASRVGELRLSRAVLGAFANIEAVEEKKGTWVRTIASESHVLDI